jgi:hypothetical protein
MTNLELQTAVRDDLSISTGDTFYSDAYIQRVVNRGLLWLANLYNWQQTQIGYKRDSVASQEYYNYPEDAKTDSIWRLDFNGIKYDRKSFDEYLTYKENYTTGASDKIYTDHRRQFFINPAPTSVAEITVWCHIKPTALSASGDLSPFDGEAELEEAIIKYASGLAKMKGRGSYYALGVADQRDAKSIADAVWKKQKAEQSKYGTKDLEIFEWFDILPVDGSSGNRRRGSFETCAC